MITLLYIQNEILVEYASQLPKTHGHELGIDVYKILFREIETAQGNALPILLHSLEACCASANDFFRLSTKLEKFCNSLVTEHDLPEKVRWKGMDLVATMSQTAVYAAERLQVFFIREINQTPIPSNLFSPAWEEDWTHNEVILELLNYLDRFLPFVETNLGNDLLYSKVLLSSCKAIVCFYVRRLVDKAESVGRRQRRLGGARPRHRRGGEGMACGPGTSDMARPFYHTKRALVRIQGDVELLKQYFAEIAEGNAALSRLMTTELRMLEVVYECLAAEDADSLKNIIIVLHKRTGANVLVTRSLLGDLWSLKADDDHDKNNNNEDPGQRHATFIRGIIQSVQPDLEMVSARMKEERRNRGLLTSSSNNSDLMFLRIDEMLRSIYEDRMTQGILPLCWACLPMTENYDGSQRVASDKVRKMTRVFVELQSKAKRRANGGRYRTLH